MGFFDGWDGASTTSSRRTYSSKKSSTASRRQRRKSGSDSPARRHSGLDGVLGSSGNYHKANASRGSFFNLGNGSSRSFGRSSSSFYKRSPRQNFVQRMFKHLKRLLRDLVDYAKRHPFKVFMLVIVPLSGALISLLARFGLRLPPSVERMLGLAARGASGDSIGAVGEAMRMARGLGVNGGRVRVERGYSDGVRWEHKTVDQGSDWSGGLMKGFSKMFF